MKRSLRTISMVVAALHLAGCYSFRPIEPATVRPGSTIRVQITNEEALRQQQTLGELTTTLQGQVVGGETTGAIGLAVRRTAAGPAGPALNTFVSVPLASVSSVEERHLNAGRTALLSAAGIAVAVAVVAISAGGTSEGEAPPDNARVAIPFLRILFR